MNVLLITLDQFRGDAIGAAGHPIVKTPNLDRLCREGVRCARHYSQAAPCGPGRASLYTGLYQLNHRVVANGAPLDRRFDNIALAARRAGYRPTLFGYTDQAIDPRQADGPTDPRLSTYEEVLPGFEANIYWPGGRMDAWTDWVSRQGYEVSSDARVALATESARPEAVSHSAFVAGRLIDWMATQGEPWFAHLSQLRPHPPYAAAGRFARMYRPDDMPAPVAPAPARAPLHEALMRHPDLAAPADEAAMRTIQAQYFGMISEVDDQLGRVWAALDSAGQWGDTYIVVTADHGEQLGDHGLIQKAGFFEQSYFIPCLIRDPRAPVGHGRTIEAFTENVDVFPTLAEAMGLEIPAQCDGASLAPLLAGERPSWWREAAHWEFDWRAVAIAAGRPEPEPGDRRRESHNLAVLRREGAAYVQFGDGTSLAFDLAADPTWRTPFTDPAAVLELAQAQLTWRARHTERTLTGMLTERGGVGRWPPMPEGWAERGA